MKIGGERDGVVYATRGLTVGTWDPKTGFDPRGTLPNPHTGRRRLAFEVVNRRETKRLLAPLVGRYTTTNVWPVGDRTLLATAGRALFRSADGGESWRHVHTLPAASGPMGVLPTSVCVSNGVVYLGEYTFDDEPARILRSDDGGETWTVHVRSTDHRHFHGVFRDPYTDRIWATAGDADDESAIGVLEDGAFRVVGAGSQRWRAVQLAFTPDSIIWGMDCSFSPEVELLRLPREAVGTADPDPVTIGTVDASVFYAETATVDGDHWVVVATAAETGLDSTAPPGAENTSSRRPRVLAARAESGYETWYELYSFVRRRTAAEYLPGIPTASAYVYLTAVGSRVVVNPFNTADTHGEVFATTLRRPDEMETERRQRDDAIPVR